MTQDKPIPGFNPNAGAPIDPKIAEQWAANYRNQPVSEEEKRGRKRITAYYFGNKILDEIRQQPGCAGIRFYMGLEENSSTDKARGKSQFEESKSRLQLLAVGVDEYGYDIVPRQDASGNILNDDGIIGDATLKCPPFCDPISPLAR